MGLFQNLVETYDAHADIVGIKEAYKVPLAPISHKTVSADIEITLNPDGTFNSARSLEIKKSKDKDQDTTVNKIIIPVTEDSAGRTSGACAHPLCDQLCYLATYEKTKHSLYEDQLKAWQESICSHPILKPILTYVENGTILADLEQTGCIQLKEDGTPQKEKLLVCWKVRGIGTPKEGCWQQSSLVTAFQNWYNSQLLNGNVGEQDSRAQEVCMILGKTLPVAEQHSKGTISRHGNAKLISSNNQDVYLGRFTSAREAISVSYEASQKAHNALHWIASNQGVAYGDRVFICWNPTGAEVISGDRRMSSGDANVAHNEATYREQLRQTLDGMRSKLPEGKDKVVIAAFDAATAGRLAEAYYNELKGSDYLKRLHDWDEHCCWFFQWNKYRANAGICSPFLYEIINCAFGKMVSTGNSERFETDKKLMGQQMQRLISCRVDKRSIPTDIVKALFNRASAPQSFKSAELRETVISTACAVIKKYHYDKYKEEISMQPDTESKDRSYQFGRLLAVMEKAERDTYTGDEKREPMAIKLQSLFCRRPLHTAKKIDEQLNRAYLPRLTPGQRGYYRKLISEIIQHLPDDSAEALNAPLKDKYLIGYYLQRKEMYTKKDKEQEE